VEAVEAETVEAVAVLVALEKVNVHQTHIQILL
jgi:hypothetical protein